MKEIIKAMADVVKSQDNLGTDHPIYMVQELKRIYGLDINWSGNWVILDKEGSEVDPPPGLDSYTAINDWRECNEAIGNKTTGFQDVWVGVQPFFTRAGALNYLKINGHNLNSPRIYVEAAHRNREWQAIRELLMEMK